MTEGPDHCWCTKGKDRGNQVTISCCYCNASYVQKRRKERPVIPHGPYHKFRPPRPVWVVDDSGRPDGPCEARG